MKPMVDILFVIDATGSMNGLILDAKKRMQSMLNRLSGEYEIDLKVGISLYRDHPSQDRSFVTAVFNLMSVEEIQKTIDSIYVDGGGDFPEAVFDGILDGVEGLSWRDNSRRLVFLIGDAPPHGMYGSDACCLCGKTWGDVISCLESKSAALYAIQMGSDTDTQESFKTLASFTGGLFLNSDIALDAVFSTLEDEFNDASTTSKILDLLAQETSVEEVCASLNIDREKYNRLKTKSII